MKKIINFPLWFIQLFGTAKSFEQNPIIGSRLLNRAGLHVARVILAHTMTKFRWWLLAPLISREERQTYREQGYIAIPDFLPRDQFERLKTELKTYDGEIRQCVQGDTATLYGLLDRQAIDGHPECGAFIRNKRLTRLMMYGGAKLRKPAYFVNCIKNGYVEGHVDPQKTFHTDTFHPTMKAWLFIDDVTDDNGPFHYVPGSHRLSWPRLKWEYWKSVKGRDLPIPYEKRGSLRGSDDDLKSLSLDRSKALKVPGNTLVMANTHGFHRRGAAPYSSRMAIYAYSRSNPFTPFPGFGNPLIAWAERYYTKKNWQNEDEKAKKNGTLASWHVVPSEKLQE